MLFWIDTLIDSWPCSLLLSEIEAIMRAVYEEANKQRLEKNRHLCAMQDKLKFTNQQLDSLTQEMKDKIHDMVDDVEQRVSKKFELNLTLLVRVIANPG